MLEFITHLPTCASAFNMQISGAAIGNIVIIVTVLGILFAWAAIFGWDRWIRLQQNQKPTPKSLFNDLCKLHHLGRAELQLLARVLEFRKQAHPAVLFTNPAHLDAYATAKSNDLADCEKLKRKLYGDAILESAEIPVT
ncbi:MAG: hypothetical protein O3A00_27435 [Planctomycetota bacterium]|nr:hypothetical protein [Planctomycetota bacterium]